MANDSRLAEEKTALMRPPVARKEPNVYILHGDRHVDELGSNN
jgi:hypothetical protein